MTKEEEKQKEKLKMSLDKFIDNVCNSKLKKPSVQLMKPYNYLSSHVQSLEWITKE